MKGNKLLFSKLKPERVKGYKKLIKSQKEYYTPPKDIARDITEAMESQGFDVTVEEARAYLVSSYATFDRRYYLESDKRK